MTIVCGVYARMSTASCASAPGNALDTVRECRRRTFAAFCNRSPDSPVQMLSVSLDTRTSRMGFLTLSSAILLERMRPAKSQPANAQHSLGARKGDYLVAVCISSLRGLCCVYGLRGLEAATAAAQRVGPRLLRGVEPRRLKRVSGSAGHECPKQLWNIKRYCMERLDH